MTASLTTWSYASAEACSTRAIGSPVAGLYSTSSCASGSLIQRSEPAEAPLFTFPSCSLASSDGVVTVVAMKPSSLPHRYPAAQHANVSSAVGDCHSSVGTGNRRSLPAVSNLA